MIYLLFPMLDFEYRIRLKIYKRKCHWIFDKKLEKGSNAISNRTMSSVVNGGYTGPGNILGNSGFDCNSYLQNGCFNEFDGYTIMRTW